MRTTSTFSIAGLLILVATYVELAYQTSSIQDFGLYGSSVAWLLGGLFCCGEGFLVDEVAVSGILFGVVFCKTAYSVAVWGIGDGELGKE